MKIIRSHGCDYRFARIFYGFTLLLGVLDQNGNSNYSIDQNFIGYTLAPLFNAVRRIEGDIGDIFNIFAPQLPGFERTGYTVPQEQSVENLISGNNRRKQLTAVLTGELERHDQPYAPYVYTIPDAPAGIMGLLASRMSERSHGPAIVLTEKTLSGSARSPQWFPVIENLGRLPGVTAAGHQQACGFRVDREERIKVVHDTIASQIESMSSEELAAVTEVEPDLTMVASGYSPLLRGNEIPIPDDQTLIDTVSWLDGMAPYGQGFPYPKILIRFEGSTSIVRPLKDGQHLKITTAEGLDLLWWNCGSEGRRLSDMITAAQDYEVSVPLNATVELGVNTFRGQSTPQAVINTLEIPR